MPELSTLEFADRMNEVMPAMIKEFIRHQANELYKGKITMPQFLLMDFLSRQGVSKMSSLAHFMRVSTAAMTGIVDRLVRDGYVARDYDPRDRRIVKIKLTGRGSDLVKKINTQRRNMVIKIFGKISAADRANYLRILMQIKNILTQEEETG